MIVEDPNDPNQTIRVDSFLLKGKIIEVGKMYEFLGEIEQNKLSRDFNEEEEQDEQNKENV